MQHAKSPDGASGDVGDLAAKLTAAAIIYAINKGPRSSTDQCPRDDGRKTPSGPQHSAFITQVPQ